MINREELQQKVLDRVSKIVETYSYSAERGIEEIEKEAVLVQIRADNTEISADERIINIMLESVILSVYAMELTIVPFLNDNIKEDKVDE